jgi:hypothetical protein
MMRYFTQQLKFTIDKCKLEFARYEENNLKGPTDRLIEILTTVYIARVKLKLVAILSASSFADWKSLAKRDDGDDEFVHGDLLRVVGAVSGNSVGFVFKRVGRKLGRGVTSGFEVVGGGIENASALVGAREFGSAVNTVVSGVGGGIGGTLQGAGEGASSVFVGAGKGMGQFFGGITGGATHAVKGLGKGIIKGNGSAVKDSLTTGVGMMGKGVRGSGTAIASGVGSGLSSLAKTPVREARRSMKSARRGGTIAKIQEEMKDQELE